MEPQFLGRLRAWLRAGYPDGVPQTDYEPLLALLDRQLTKDEIKEVTAGLIESAGDAGQISRIDAGVAIFEVTNELPSERDIERVRARLERDGWPFDDEPLR